MYPGMESRIGPESGIQPGIRVKCDPWGRKCDLLEHMCDTEYGWAECKEHGWESKMGGRLGVWKDVLLA